MSSPVKRWLPFAGLITIAFVSFGFLLFSGSEDAYRPQTDDPARIYREACRHCHGPRGEGTGLLYPAFDHADMDIETIKKKIAEGALLMPAFIHIRQDTLEILARYIEAEGYKEPGYKKNPSTKKPNFE